MEEFKNNLNEEETHENNQVNTENEDYTWYDDEYNPAISGTVSEKHALSIYRPKVKKNRFKNPVFAAIISSIVTTAICLGIFAAASGIFAENNGRASSSSLSIVDNGNGDTKAVANKKNGEIMSVPDIYDTVSPSVVSIICTSQGGGLGAAATSSGSGVILTKDGYVVTNNHVIDGASIITVKTIAGQSLDAQLVGADARTDLAVLKVECDKDLPYADLGNSAALRVGDIAVAIGNPLQEELVSTLTVGYISAINRTMIVDDRQMTMLQTDAAINPGNSGGALINAYGQVIGITTLKSTGYDVEGLGFAIPINEAIPVVESIIEHGYVTGRPLVGITGIDVTESIAAANDLPVGVYVDSVVSGGAADKGGIKPGDVITKFDGKKIENVDQINTIRDEHKVGDKIEVVVSRNGKKVKCTIVLQEEKPSKQTQNETQQAIPDASQGGTQQYGFPSDFFSFFGW